MKPLGPIPAGFAMIDGELAIGTRTASSLVAEAGQTPVFVYSAALIRRRRNSPQIEHTRLSPARAAPQSRLPAHP